MSFDVHIGVKPNRVERMKNTLASYPHVTEVFSDGDDWHVWGEPVEEDRHVIARFKNFGTAADFSRLLCTANGPFFQHLVPMRGIEGHYEGGILACVTQSEDWSKEYLSIYPDKVKVHAGLLEDGVI